MACHNHTSARLDVVSTQPLDQCTTCAQKHIENAFGLYHEYLYRDINRALIRWNLRAAALHTMYAHPDIALRSRALANLIQLNRDDDITTEWTDLLSLVSRAFYDDNPSALARLNSLAARAKQK